MNTTVRMPGAGARGGDGVGEVAGAGAGEHLGVELAGGAQRAGDDPVLEGVGRVGRVVLDPQGVDAELAAEVVRLEQPGEAGLGVGALLDVVRHRQQRLVAPDVARAGLDLLAGDGREVVGDLERAEALRTGVVRAEVDLVAALAAGERRWRCRRRPRASAGRVGVPCRQRAVLTESSFSSSPRRTSPRAGISTVSTTAGAADGGGSRRLPGRQRAVPSVPLDELMATLRRRVSRCAHRVHMLAGSRDVVAAGRPPATRRRGLSASGVAGEAGGAGRGRRRARDRRRRRARAGRTARRRRSRPGGWACPRRAGRRRRRRPRGRRGRRRRRGSRRLQAPRRGCSTTRPLCIPGERTSITCRPGSTARSCSRGRSLEHREQPLEGAPRVVEPPGVHGDGEALLLDVRVAGVRRAAAAGQLAPMKRDRPCGGRGETIRRLVDDQRSLPYWPKR